MVPGYVLYSLDLRGGGVGLLSLLLYFTGFFRKGSWSLLDGMALVVLIYSIVRLSFSTWSLPRNAARVMTEEMISHTAWVQIIFFGGLYFLGRILFRQMSRNSITWLLTGILWTGIGQAVYGLGQLYGIWASHHSGFPMTGSFFNPGPYSGWLACLVPIAIWVLVPKRNLGLIDKMIRVSAWIYLFVAGGVLIAAFSRAAWLAGAAGSVIVLWPYARRYMLPSRKQRKWTFPLLGIFIVVVLAGLYFFKKDSADGRLLIWSASMDMVEDYPLFGVGWDRFKVMYPRYQAYYFDGGRGTDHQAYLAGYAEYPFNEVLGR